MTGIGIVFDAPLLDVSKVRPTPVADVPCNDCATTGAFVTDRGLVGCGTCQGTGYVPDGIVTIHVPNGAPGATDPVQVTHRQMRQVKEDFLTRKNQSRQSEALLIAYAKFLRRETVAGR